MPETDIFASLYGKLGMFGILVIVVWKVYHDMKSNNVEIRSELSELRSRYETYRDADHERVIKTLQDNATSRNHLTEAINRMSRATENLPCNQSQPSDVRWTTPVPQDTPTPLKGNSHDSRSN